jgi:hypothetical protein
MWPKVVNHLDRSGSSLALVVLPVFTKPWLKEVLSRMIAPPLFFHGGSRILIRPEGREIFGEEGEKGQNWSWIVGLCASQGAHSKDFALSKFTEQQLSDGQAALSKVASTILGGGAGQLGHMARTLQSSMRDPRMCWNS